ncbi:MAG: flagellar hook-length control protein FliK [Clostridiaceae bacterium]|nr:flagellar hook-length control protein FliK [Clostridiaceae bacterium]
MNFIELMMGSITVDQTAVPFRTETRQTDSGNSSSISFAQMLGSRMSRPSLHAENTRSPAATAAVLQPSSNGSVEQKEPLYKSFRQVRQSIQEKENGERQTVRKAPSEDKAESKDEGSVMQVLAQLLGVDQKVLNRLLEESGISQEALDSLENTAETALILSDILGLDPDQQKTLERLLEMIKGSMTADSHNEDIQRSIPLEPDSQLTHETQETVGSAGDKQMPKDVLDPVAAQLISKISDMLDEFAERLDLEQDTVEDEIEKLMMPLLKKSETSKQNIIDEGQTAMADADPVKDPEGTDAINGQDPKLQEEDAGEKKELDMKDGDGEQELVPKPVQSSDEGVQHVFMNTASDSTRTAEVGHIAPERPAVPAREIIGQIVEKAGALITQDKAEMVMELKPDSLGRISLKVVTENGIVMARFVAENRQVQQVLETNMQMLKDSLERQGINVQSLSVSVRQDEGQQRETRQRYGDSQRIGSKRPVTAAKAAEGITTGYVEENAGRNPYMWESSTIDLTA